MCVKRDLLACQKRPDFVRLCNARARAAADNRSLLPNNRSLLTGRVCAAADNLGRVLLLDMEDLTVLRFFKGYRESEVIVVWRYLIVCQKRPSYVSKDT